jgi:hypothetical protein
MPQTIFANHTFSKEFDKEFISKPYREFLKKTMGTKFEQITNQKRYINDKKAYGKIPNVIHHEENSN